MELNISENVRLEHDWSVDAHHNTSQRQPAHCTCSLSSLTVRVWGGGWRLRKLGNPWAAACNFFSLPTILDKADGWEILIERSTKVIKFLQVCYHLGEKKMNMKNLLTYADHRWENTYEMDGVVVSQERACMAGGQACQELPWLCTFLYLSNFSGIIWNINNTWLLIDTVVGNKLSSWYL